jgi:nucleotide-binding universal stress UspA family protein
MTTSSPVIVATDLTDASRPALVRGRAHAAAVGAPLVVCHVVADFFRDHPLIPDRRANELVLSANVVGLAAERTSEQVEAVLGLANGEYRVEVETGVAAEEIVRIAERTHASLIVVGANPNEGVRRVIGHVAEPVVRYAHTSVLVARDVAPTGKILVATDFTEGSRPALSAASALARGAEVTLLHVVKPPSSALASALMPLGVTWTPPAKSAMDQLRALGDATLANLAKEYGLTAWQQLEGEPADVILERAEALGVDTIVTGSRGRRGLARLVLGSVAEDVVRRARCNVLVAREPGSS